MRITKDPQHAPNRLRLCDILKSAVDLMHAQNIADGKKDSAKSIEINESFRALCRSYGCDSKSVWYVSLENGPNLRPYVRLVLEPEKRHVSHAEWMDWKGDYICHKLTASELKACNRIAAKVLRLATLVMG